jgi:MFS superfamily sulfate permease-like transporter
MLVYTGSRLAHPTEFINAYRIGREQLVIFATTVFAVLATDLLVGVGIGVAVKMLIHLVNGVPLSSMFKPFLEVEEVDQQTSLIVARGSAVFSNWIPFRRQIEQIGLVQRRNIVVDLSNTRLVDHSVMEKLGDLRRDFEREGLALEVRGLDTLRPYTADPHAARKRDALPAARLALVIEAEHADAAQDAIAETLRERGGEAAFVATPGAAAWGAHRGGSEAVRIDVLGLRPACDAVVEALRDSACADAVLTAWIEPVEPVPFGPTGAEAVRRELATRAP